MAAAHTVMSGAAAGDGLDLSGPEDDAAAVAGLDLSEVIVLEDDAAAAAGLDLSGVVASEEDDDTRAVGEGLDLDEALCTSQAQEAAVDDADLADLLSQVQPQPPAPAPAAAGVTRLRLVRRPSAKVKPAERDLTPPKKSAAAAPKKRGKAEAPLAPVKRARRAARTSSALRRKNKAGAEAERQMDADADEAEDADEGLIETLIESAARKAQRTARRLPVTQLAASVADDPVVASFLTTTPGDRTSMVAAAAAIRTGARPLAESVLGPPVTYENLVGHAPPQRTSLHQLVDDIIGAMVNAATDSATARRADTGPMLVSAWDMVQHYLVSAEPRPSPVDASIVLSPHACAAGDRCIAFRDLVPSCAVSPHSEGGELPRTFRLVGMLPEAEMRAFYASGVWPSTRVGGDPPCVICSVTTSIRLALALERLPSASRPLTGVLIQPVCCDTDERHGFQKHALLECSVSSMALERPVLNVISSYFRRAWHTGVHCLDLVPEVMQQPARFFGSDLWASDFHDRAGAYPRQASVSTSARPVPGPPPPPL